MTGLLVQAAAVADGAGEAAAVAAAEEAVAAAAGGAGGVGVAAVIIKHPGVSAAKALAYDYGPGRRSRSTTIRGGWLARWPGGIGGHSGRAMQAKLREDGDTVAGKRGRVIRLAVSAAPQGRVLSDREWAGIAGRVVGVHRGR